MHQVNQDNYHYWHGEEKEWETQQIIEIFQSSFLTCFNLQKFNFFLPLAYQIPLSLIQNLSLSDKNSIDGTHWQIDFFLMSTETWIEPYS